MTEEDLITACTSIGVHVVFMPFPLAGAYYHDTGLIVIDSRLPETSQLATLAYEYVHALRGHDGPQSASMERYVDPEAARLLISPAEYALAEYAHEGSTVGIAEELGVPVWVVEAYRQALYDEFVSAH
ncbi:ImmA/IrrE family metallo-endopeptidase [Trueperella pyogenes]|uniref:ImmA/IrrE family metallo-endopeptidase n=1 Tax=Trueperella pyogenes TaxID=1661 RepID=UPI00345CD5CE